MSNAEALLSASQVQEVADIGRTQTAEPSEGLRRIIGRGALILGLIASGALAATVESVLESPLPAYATTFVNDYPDGDAVSCPQFGDYSWCKSGSPFSSRLYGYRNCTDGAAYWTKKYTGVTLPNLGDAKTWDDRSQGTYAVYPGNTINIEPGDIAQSDDGTYGHVGFVTSVTKDSSGIVTSFVTAELNQRGVGLYNGTEPSGVTTYNTKNASGNFIRPNGGGDWDHFIDVNGLNHGLNNEDLNAPAPNADTDSDGIPNNIDSCPAQAGPASNNGCPIQGVQHVFTGETNGKINEIYWGTGNVGVTNSEKYTFGSPVTALANVLYNNSWHVYTGTAGGEVYETYWGNGNNNPTTWLLTDLNTPIDSMSVQITGNGLQHVYTGTDAGTINETYWGDIFGNNPATQQLANVGSPVKALGSYFINNTQHVYSGTQDGKLRETYWGNGNNLTTWLVGTVVGSVASLDVKITGNGLQHIYSGTSAGKVYETYWGDIFGNSTATVEKASFASPVNSVSAQVDSNLTHIYSATNAGDVYETYWGNLSLATQQLAAIGAPVVRIASAITGNGLQHVYAATSDGRIYETYWGDSFGNTKTTWQVANVGSQVAGLVVRIT